VSRSDRAATHLQERLDVLGQVIELAPGRLPAEVSERLVITVERARGRLGHSTSHTVVALAGPTGSGKSSTFNALAGQDLAAVGVRRPTTSSTQAAVFGPGDDTDTSAARLLDWLGVSQRRSITDPDLTGLVLLDLPDHDSTTVQHRQEVDRLVEVVDVFVWVVDPQKYADAALHEGYLRRFAGHADVTLVVLNQLDTLAPDARRAAVEDLRALVRADGMAVARPGLAGKLPGQGGGVRIMGMSVHTGDGVDALRREISARVAERRALVARLDADLDWVAEDLASATGDREPGPVSDRAADRAAAAFAVAAGVAGVADAVGHAHRLRGGRVAGWPPTRWVSHLRPDPLRRLGLAGVATTDGAGEGEGEGDRHAAPTSLPPTSVVATAGVATATRQLVDDASDGLPETWRLRLGEVAVSRRDNVADALDRAIRTTPLPVDRPRWWTAAGAVQATLAAAMVVGLVWLLLTGVVAWFGLPDLPTPEVGAVPVPTVLALGGALAGIVLAAMARWAIAVGARRRAAAARRRLEAATRDVANGLVVDPVNDELRAMADLRALAVRAR
jgi:energy-coupling factor transporter ATP-binding protein EcfA2